RSCQALLVQISRLLKVESRRHVTMHEHGKRGDVMGASFFIKTNALFQVRIGQNRIATRHTTKPSVKMHFSQTDIVSLRFEERTSALEPQLGTIEVAEEPGQSSGGDRRQGIAFRGGRDRGVGQKALAPVPSFEVEVLARPEP